MRVERGAQLGDQRRQRIGEIAVLALAEAVAGHQDVAAEMLLVLIKGGDASALLGCHQPLQHGAAEGVELTRQRRPIVASDPLLG